MLGLLADKGIIFSGVKDELKLEQDFASRWQKESEMLAKENDQLNKENEQLQKQVAEYEMILRQHEFAEQEGFR